MEFDDSVLTQCSSNADSTMEAERKQLMTFNCEKCHTILGDSLSVCGELKWMDPLIMCLKVTEDVVVGDANVSGHDGEMSDCIYSSLKCRGCCSVVGKLIHAAPPHLAQLRSIFLLSKENISCYILNSSSMVKASTLAFDLKPLKESLDELRPQCDDQLDQLLRVEGMLADRSFSSQSTQQ
ncbi:protein Mis18-beta isoform X2 [Genypterus blacodes]|uniref:protein Mis18-beta isoform X2 n=1 Tax=Genypterus blacodes TaxID=154954 RepID=UPI003F775144